MHFFFEHSVLWTLLVRNKVCKRYENSRDSCFNIGSTIGLFRLSTNSLYPFGCDNTTRNSRLLDFGPLLMWIQSGFQVLPREFQLTATIAPMSGRNFLVDGGTGAGKTFCTVPPCLLAPETKSIIFSPLKRPKAVQVLTFARYEIKAIAINEDTPNALDLWKVCVRSAP